MWFWRDQGGMGDYFSLRSWRCDRVCDQCSDELSGEKIIGKAKEKGSKAAEKLARPISLLLTIVLVVGVIVLVMFGLIPQLTATIGSLMNSIAEFIPQMQSWVREFTHNNREIMDLVNQVEFNPNKAIQWGMSILGMCGIYE